jgi:hypothetical protein
MKKQIGWIAILVVILASCKSKEPVSQHQEYFNLITYVRQEIPDILNQYHKAAKIVIVNGSRDSTTITLDSNQLKNYFQPIIALDINKPALKGTYDIQHFTDSTTGQLSIVYTSNTFNTQPYQLYLNIGKDYNISSLYVISSTHNVLYNSSKKILYQAGKFIQIITEQKMIFFTPKKTEITILFEK